MASMKQPIGLPNTRARKALALAAAALFLITASAIGAQVNATPAAAVSADRQSLAQSLMSSRQAGKFDSISYGVIDRLIAPIAAGTEPSVGCKVDTRVLQVMVLTVQDFGSMRISDINRSCAGVLQDPTCPTNYTSPHCADPARAIDIISVGSTAIRGGAESVPYLQYLNALVPVGSVAGQAQCGSSVALSNFARINDSCDHLHIALPVNGTLNGIPNSGPSTPERYAVLGTDGTLWVKEANPYANWVPQASNVTSFSLSGYRIGVVSGGTAYVKDGDLYAGWVQMSGAGGIKDIVLDGVRVGILGNDGVLNVKEGNLSAPWVQQSGGVKRADLAGNRIGIIGTNAVVSVKEGDLYAGWVGQGVADDISLSGNRIGKIVGGVAMVKEGNLSAGWTTMTGGTSALDIELEGARVGVNTAGGLLVKEGGLSASWTNQANGVDQFSLSGDKIGILKGGLSIVKEGTLWDGWINQMPNTTRIEVAN